MSIFLACLAAFAAGFIDSIVGGGGLVQAPALFILFPHYSVPQIIGTNRFASFMGTGVAGYQYSKKVKIPLKTVLFAGIGAGVMSYSGALISSLMSERILKPTILVLMTLIAIYTYFKKDFGQFQIDKLSQKQTYIYGSIICVFLGFYDGFIGPGTGSLLIMAFIAILGFDFLNANIYAKLVNLATNIGSITLFVLKGKIIWTIAIPMAICNVTGSWLGARLAISKGNGFIRVFFLIVVGLALLRFGYDVFLK